MKFIAWRVRVSSCLVKLHELNEEQQSRPARAGRFLVKNPARIWGGDMTEFQILVPNDRKVESVMGDGLPAAVRPLPSRFRAILQSSEARPRVDPAG
jgi:hypothetical protein